MTNTVRALIVTLALGIASACSSPTASTDVDSVQLVITNGTLRLELGDAPSPVGMLFARPSVSAGTGQLTVTNTRYGSLCQLAVSGSADVTGSSVVIHVTYSERLTICTADIRKLTYRATVTGLTARTYTVRVVHDEGNGTNEVLNETVVVK